MLSYLKWTFWILFWALTLSVLHYTLPRWDVVRIIETYERRETFGANSIFWSGARTGSGDGEITRDIFFIGTITEGDRPIVYRNEDTGWGWPPFFKFDSANLQTRAANLRSSEADPNWVAVKHYGWRSEFITIYPNAVRLKQVAGPDDRPIPWTSIAILIGLACVFWAIYARWRRFVDNRIDPLLDGEV